MKNPVFVPQLPTTDELLPYLREIELSRNYSNFGPMVLRLHSELANYFGVQVDQVVTLTNATLALEGAITTASQNKNGWLSPSWTFAATNLALARCRVDYRFGDIDKNWRLLTQNTDHNILDVCPFGDKLDLSRFGQMNNTILVDAAASFPALKDCGQLLANMVGDVGIVVSFHPTKILPGIEGGVFISNRPEWVKLVKQWSRFGMELGSRTSKQTGTNAKMNEFQAAVILASMKKFEMLKYRWEGLHHLAREVSSALSLKCHPSMRDGQISTYWIVEDSSEFIELVEEKSEQFGFHTIRWWEFGCHTMPYFQKSDSNSLPESTRVANSTIGLPFHSYMEKSDFDMIYKSLLAMRL